jgi:hypothetical protein
VTAARAVVAWWFAPQPATRLAALRLVIGLYAIVDLAVRLPILLHYAEMPASEFRPVGVVALALDAPLPAWVAQSEVWWTLALALAFTAGVAYRVVAPLFALHLLWTLTYRNCWGMVFHTENLPVIHVAILACAPAADAWSIDAWRRARRGVAPPPPEGHADGRHGWAIRAICAVTAVTYVLAGVAKLRLAGVDWIDGAQLRDQIAYDNLRRVVYGLSPSALATPLLGAPWVFTALAALTMVVELGAPLALVHRRIAAAWCALAWGFHAGVLALMHIAFPYPLLGVAYASFCRIERPVGWCGRQLARGARAVNRMLRGHSRP